GRFVRLIDRVFEQVRRAYQRLLQGLLQTWSVVVVMGLLLFGATLLLGMTSKSELTPEEDQGFVFYQLKAAPDATAQQMLGYSQQMFAIGRKRPEYEMKFQIITPRQGIGGMRFKPRDQRSNPAPPRQQELKAKVSVN